MNHILACAKKMLEEALICAQVKRRQGEISAANFLKKVLFVTLGNDA